MYRTQRALCGLWLSARRAIYTYHYLISLYYDTFVHCSNIYSFNHVTGQIRNETNFNTNYWHKNHGYVNGPKDYDLTNTINFTEAGKRLYSEPVKSGSHQQVRAKQLGPAASRTSGRLARTSGAGSDRHRPLHSARTPQCHYEYSIGTPCYYSGDTHLVGLDTYKSS